MNPLRMLLILLIALMTHVNRVALTPLTRSVMTSVKSTTPS